MGNRNNKLASERKSDIVAAALKGSRCSLERKRSMEEQMDHDVFVLASRLEEEFACVSRDRKSTRLNSSHLTASRMPSSA